jgi:hypothetical protein
MTHLGTSKLLHFKLMDGSWHPRLIHDEFFGAIILMSCLYNMFNHRPSPAPDLILQWQPTSAPAADIVQTESASVADTVQPTFAPAANTVHPASESLLHLLHKDKTEKTDGETDSSTDKSKLHSVIGQDKCFTAVPPRHCYKDYVQTNTLTTILSILKNPRLHHKQPLTCSIHNRQLSMVPIDDINVSLLTEGPRHYLEGLIEDILRLVYNQFCQNNQQAPLGTLTEPLLLESLPDVTSDANEDSVLKLQVLILR